MAISDIELEERLRIKSMGRPPDFLSINSSGEVEIGGRRFKLRDLRQASPGDEGFDRDRGEGRAMAARALAPHWGGVNRSSSPVAMRDVVSHQDRQTPLRDQLDRPTCLSFATVAAIESLNKAERGTDIDLSEQLCNFLLEGDNCLNFLFTQNAPAKFGTLKLCEESLAPYQARADVARNISTCSQLPFNFNNAGGITLYSIDQFHVLERAGLDGPSILNTDYLEYLLEQGHDIVLDLRLAGEGVTKVLDVIRDPDTGEPLRSFHAHVVLVAGYDRTADPKHFLCKSSISTGDEYWKVSYDYVRAYARAGFIIESIKVSAPSAELRVHPESCMAPA